MRAVILAGGYGKRMGPMGDNMPKALIKIGDRPVIEYILEKLEAVRDIDIIYINTNERFEGQFAVWLDKFRNSKKTIKLVIEPHSVDHKKLGSIGALMYLVEKEKIDNDLMVINGDNLFEFDLNTLVDFFKEKQKLVIGFYDVKSLENAGRFGVGKLNSFGKLVDFEEKPETPKSTLISTGCYIFPRSVLELLSFYLAGKNNPDAPGHFIKWFYKRWKAYGFVFKKKWFDIGSLETLREARNYFG